MTSPRPVHGVASLLALLACLALPLAAVSAWFATELNDTDAYVASVGPLADDPVVQAAAAARIEQVALDAANVPGPLRSAFRPALHAVVEQVVASKAFEQAWTTANRSAHRELLAVLSGSDDSLVDRDGRVMIRLGPVVASAFDILVDRGLVRRAQVPEVEASFTLARSDDLGRARQVYQLLDGPGLWLPALWLALVVLALALSRSRRRTVGLLAFGSLLTGLLLAGAIVVSRSLVVGRAPDEDQALAGAVWDAVVHPLWLTLAVAGVVAVGALLLRVAAGMLGGRRSPRTTG